MPTQYMINCGHTFCMENPQLEELGIYTLKNDFTGAFMGLVQPSIDLWINEDDFPNAKSVNRGFYRQPTNNTDKIY